VGEFRGIADSIIIAQDFEKGGKTVIDAAIGINYGLVS
jgi:hypothetical protein